MNATTGTTLAEQRQALRQRLRAQRQVIADQLGPAPETNGGYPRSKTMRFLTGRPALSATLLAELAALLVGARYAKSITAILAVARVVRSAAIAKSPRPSAPRASDPEAPPIS